jgi:hypothetical protein
MQIASPPALSHLLDYKSFSTLLKPCGGLFTGQAKGFCVIVHSSEREGLDRDGAGFYSPQRLGDNSGGRNLLALCPGLQPAVSRFVEPKR